jgi:hypothetical protein
VESQIVVKAAIREINEVRNRYWRFVGMKLQFDGALAGPEDCADGRCGFGHDKILLGCLKLL